MSRIRETITRRIEEAEATPLDPHVLAAEGCLKIKDAAEFTGLSQSEIRKCIANGSLPHMRDGKAVRVPRVALKDFIATRMVFRRDLVRIERGVAVVRERSKAAA